MGGKQLGFSDYELTTAKKQTKREKFLSEMEAVVPWQALTDRSNRAPLPKDEQERR
jgi:transposase, IS5 family